MIDRRQEIDKELQHLTWLASHLTDQKTLDGIKDRMADLEAEKATRDKK
jgi:hypothetical protein